MNEATAPDRIGRSAAPWGLWLLGLAAAFHPTLRAGFRDFQIGVGDPRLVQYLLEHAFRWMRAEPLHASLWSPPVFHPALGTAASTDTILGSAPLYGIWRLAGIDVDPSFQLWMASCLSLDFAAAYWLLSRSLHASPRAAALGAFVFGFGSVRLASFNNPQLFVLFYGIFALHALLRACELERDRRSAALWLHLAALLLALQVWSCWYPSFLLIFVLAVAGTGALAFADTRGHLLRCLRLRGGAFLSASLLFVGAIAPMVRAHLLAADETGWRSYALVEPLLPIWASWIYAGQTSLAYGWLASLDTFDFVGPEAPHANGVGLVTSGVAIAGLWRVRREPVARLVLLGMALVFLVSTRLPWDFSPWAAVHAWVPGAASLRYVARIGMYLSLAAAIGVAMFFDGGLGRRAGRTGLALLLATLCLAEQLHQLKVRPTRAYRRSVLEIAGEIDPGCKAFFLQTEHEPPRSEGVWRQSKRTHIASMWISLEAGVPTINGGLGSVPRGWVLQDADAHDAATRDALEQALQVWLASRAVAPEQVCRLRIPARLMPATALWEPRSAQERRRP